ncbi:MAG: rod shape-determining protein MreC [Ignavibacteriaceae bacterium]
MIKVISYLWDRFKEYIVLVILIIISFTALSLNENPKIKKIRSIAFGGYAAVTYLFSDFLKAGSIIEENKTLRETNARLMLQLSLLRQYGLENNELKNLLAFKDSVSLPLIPATVISRSFSTTQGTITINKGTSDNISSGMPVINDKGLIGIVYLSSPDYSVARLLKNVDLKIAVKDERSRVNGILEYDGDNLRMTNVPKTFDIKSGDRIVTSEVSSVVPVPVPVGVVVKIADPPGGIFREIIVEPFADLYSAENLFVLAIENRTDDIFEKLSRGTEP